MQLVTYTKSGNGPEPLLAFHGIGQDHTAYEPWVKLLGDRYTIYAFDLPFHGMNTKRQVHPITLDKTQWKQQISDFLKKEGIVRFSVVGFSMGGRFALTTVEMLPDQVNKLYLLAPDGILKNPYYTFAVRNRLTRRIFKYVTFNPSLVMKWTGVGERMKIIHPSMSRFVHWMLDSPEKRKRIFLSWVSFRHFHFSLSSLITLFNRHALPIQFYMGEFDRMMPPDSVLPLTTKIPTAQRFILNSGHNHMIEKTAEFLAQQNP
ncbi:alpha/beta fold hydrolase [Siphonobacter sp. SORGH_AS_0500]|uniref:alpha/beta fold hydrolase n=1 Tax=Siphonobacter sp. SORGH_AS_0500 TaxID=1864824 RepID=UPI000CA6700D|nr:alpha/beta hydrolase [Siphonobacter sp. SORGH_AS_0500]MDR6193507.1 pimeloyl-ACP methyl ester carboxylesterase [Siphonobacter sp. SORGH_AS_0500]PKK36371.1 hypothetical protein BWI96_10910 [Siphonobacter sp. SORGH_AS_0500]